MICCQVPASLSSSHQLPVLWEQGPCSHMASYQPLQPNHTCPLPGVHMHSSHTHTWLCVPAHQHMTELHTSILRQTSYCRPSKFPRSLQVKNLRSRARTEIVHNESMFCAFPGCGHLQFVEIEWWATFIITKQSVNHGMIHHGTKQGIRTPHLVRS